jgi:uncharacterized protein HemY
VESQHSVPALVERSRVPRAVLARSLDEAGTGMLVHVDRHGHVRSPVRYHLLQGVGYLGLGGILSLPLLYGVIFGPAGALLGGGLSVLSVMRVRPSMAVQRAIRLSAHGRFDEAEPLLQRAATAWLAPRATRAAAHHGLAVCHAMRGDFEAALHHVRLAYQRRAQPTLQSRIRIYLEIHLLVNLDRVSEARAQLAALGSAPEGEFLRVAHWLAELYVCMAEGDHDLSDDELHERARKALAMTAGSPLLGLCAWAHVRRGDRDQAEHLLAEAFDRLADDRIEHIMPRLHAWMEENRPAPRDDDW